MNTNCTLEFPPLGETIGKHKFKSQKKVNSTDRNDGNCAYEQRTKLTKRARFRGPINANILDLIKNCINKKKIGTVKVLRRSEINRCGLGGNKLDSDQPKRHRGKVKLGTVKYTGTKKLINKSRQQRKNSIFKRNWTSEGLSFKGKLSMSIRNNSEISELINDLSQINLNENESLRNSEEVREMARNIVHSHKFKPYCDNLLTTDLRKLSENLITTLRKFQDNLHARDPVKAAAKRRYVCGFKESKKYLLVGDVKCLFVATNLEMVQGLPSFSILKTILDAANEKRVPVVFAALAEKIGYWTCKKRKISVLAVMNYDGANDVFKDLLDKLNAAKESYNKLINLTEEILISKYNITKAPENELREVEDEIRLRIMSKLEQ